MENNKCSLCTLAVQKYSNLSNSCTYIPLLWRE